MTVTLDKFGRVLIPKPVRDRLGLAPGADLTVVVHDEGDGAPTLELTPERDEDLFVRKGKLLVYTGALPPGFDTAEFVREQRDERARTLGGAFGDDA